MARAGRGNSWTVEEAQSRLDEIMERARVDGPQRIGDAAPLYVVSEQELHGGRKTSVPMGRWLIENMPRGEELVLPSRTEPERALPFSDEPDGR